VRLAFTATRHLVPLPIFAVIAFPFGAIPTVIARHQLAFPDLELPGINPRQVDLAAFHHLATEALRTGVRSTSRP
jgi:hypothetical protein